MSEVKSNAVKQGLVAVLATVALGAPAYGAGLEGLAGVKADGYVEMQANHNFNRPANNSNNSSVRAFDTRANSFTFNMAELALRKTSESGPGFGLVLNYGPDAQVIDLDSGSPAPADEFEVQQAYISDKVLGGNVDLKFGKFATLAGAEVIEGPANFNISRSVLFLNALPFTHTGLRATIPADAVSIVVGLNNGWDNNFDNNQSKTLELQVGLAPAEMFSGTVTTYYGGESVVTSNDIRTLVDIVATIKPMGGVTFVLNYDRKTEADGLTATGGTTHMVSQGYAAYANLALDDKHSVTLRGEVFDNETTTLREITLTFSCKMKENLEWRAELRHDGSDSIGSLAQSDVFQDEDGFLTGSQNTVALAAYYSF